MMFTHMYDNKLYNKLCKFEAQRRVIRVIKEPSGEAAGLRL